MSDNGDYFKERKPDEKDVENLLELAERYKRVWNGFDRLNNQGKLSGTLNFLLSVLASAEVPPEAVKELFMFAIAKYEKKMKEIGDDNKDC